MLPIAAYRPVSAAVASVVGRFSDGGGGGAWQGRTTGRAVQRRDVVRTERCRDRHGRTEARTARRGATCGQDAQTSWQVSCLVSPVHSCITIICTVTV